MSLEGKPQSLCAGQAWNSVGERALGVKDLRAHRTVLGVYTTAVGEVAGQENTYEWSERELRPVKSTTRDSELTS